MVDRIDANDVLDKLRKMESTIISLKEWARRTKNDERMEQTLKDAKKELKIAQDVIDRRRHIE